MFIFYNHGVYVNSPRCLNDLTLQDLTLIILLPRSTFVFNERYLALDLMSLLESRPQNLLFASFVPIWVFSVLILSNLAEFMKYFCLLGFNWFERLSTQTVVSLLSNMLRDMLKTIETIDVFTKTQMNYELNFHHVRHVALLARNSLTLSCHPSLSSIVLGRSSRLHPVSTQSCCI